MKRRWFGAAIILSGSAVGHAQVAVFGPTGSMIRSLQEHAQIPTLDPNAPKADGDSAKLPDPQDEDKSLQLVKSGPASFSDGDVTIKGPVEFFFRGYHMFADDVVGNRNTAIFSLKGNVMLIGKDAVVSGDSITVDFNKKTYHATKSSEDVKPSLLKGSFLKDVYGKGQDIYGSSNEQQILFGDLTTCDLPNPHYDIAADNIIVRPGKRAIFRRAKIKLFGRTIIRIPYLVIPLDDRNYNNTPIVGQSPIEGYYIKYRYGVPLHGDNILFTHTDLMTKLGVGLGADYLYRSRLSHGDLQVYTILGPGEMLKVSNDHNQRFNWGTLSLRTDFEKNNYLVNPGATTESVQALLAFPQRNNTVTRLTINQSGSSSNGYSSNNESVSVSDTRRWTQKISTNVSLDYQENGTKYAGSTGANSQTNQTLNVRTNVTDDLDKATAELTYQKMVPIGSTQAISGANNQTPVVTLSSDARKLIGPDFAQNWPFHTSLSIGEFTDQTHGNQITRDYFDFGFTKIDKSQGAFHSDVQGEFKQGMYSDGTAEYVLNFADTESYRISKQSSFNLRYNYLRPYGYSPLGIDFTGQTNTASADFSYKVIKSVSIGAQSGYDLLRLQQHLEAWQPVGARLEFQPADYFTFRAQSTYDTFVGAWSNVRLDLSYKPGATFLSMGGYYDGLRHTWSNASMFLDGLKMGRTKLGAILNFNGFTGRFDSQQYSMTYDLHCAEAVMTVINQNTGFNPGTTYQFFIRLKALPFNSSFGTGSRGQALGTGTGIGY